MSHTPERWFVGAMNDGLFIINRPPRPAPVDHLTEGDPETEVIATVHGKGALGRANKIAAAPLMYEALKDTLRILKAVRYTAGLGKKQIERIEAAEAVLALAGE